MNKTPVAAVKPKEQNSTSQQSIEVADLIVSYLEDIGTEYVFGVPGGAIEPIYNALARSERRGGPRPIVARHESGAAFMADGYARETGKVGVCIATSGPGATNLITGVACAYDNNIPLLVLTGQPPLPAFGKRALQESAFTGVNVLGMFANCTRYNTLISHPEQVETNLVNALLRARHEPAGPVHLSFPVDILRSTVTAGKQSYDLASLFARAPILMDQEAVHQLCEELQQAQSIVFLIGGGCGHSIEPILELARLTGALLLTTPDGKGFLNPEHRAYRGVFGFAGHPSADALLRSEPDLIVAFGTSMGEWTSGNWSKTLLNNRLIHVDPCEEHLMRSPMARLQVRGPIRAVTECLIKMLRPTLDADADGDSDVVPIFREITVNDPAKMHSDAVPIKPQRLMHELSRRCPSNTCFVADAGNSTAWAVHYLELRDRRGSAHTAAGIGRQQRRPSASNGWLRVTMDFAPMGWAIGAAVGIACATPGRPVVCITGDGSYLMNGQEITVAAHERVPVLFVILNDAALGMVKHGQRLAGAERIAFELPRVDFRLLAESLGVPGHVVRSPEDLERLDFEAILRREGPTLLDVRIDEEEIPPMTLRMKTLTTVEK